MTVKEIYVKTTSGGGNDFAEVIEICRKNSAPFCLIGGMAVIVYV